jgi:superfamily II DNA or RNA helicase
MVANVTDVVIKKINNVFIQVIADSSVRMGLSEHFARFVKGYMFQPKYKAKVWDGKIRFFNYQTGYIYAGLIKDVLDYCSQDGLSVSVDEDVKLLFNSSRNSNDYIDSLKLSAHGSKIEFREYQKKAIQTSILQKRKLIQSPTSSGKSSIIYGICRYLIDEVFDDKEKILIIVPTLNLVSQLKSDFKDYSTLNNWDVDSNVGFYTGKTKEKEKRILISTWQSIYKEPPEWFEEYRGMICDEVHLAAAKSISDIGKKCEAEYRIGLSGSINEEDETNDLTLRGLFGFKHVTTTTKKLMEDGIVADLTVKCIHVKYSEPKPKISKEYADEITWIARQKERNEFIINLGNSLSGNVLILFSLVEKHGKILLEIAKKQNKEVFFVYGGTDVDQREKIRALAEKHKGCIILASYQTFSTGVNIRNINHIVFASPTKSFTRVIQSIGRGLRVSETKTSCDVYDLFDEIHGNVKAPSSYNHTFKHFVERVKIYISEGFKYEIEKLELEATL